MWGDAKTAMKIGTNPSASQDALETDKTANGQGREIFHEGEVNSYIYL
jgi:hypothetical protein